MHKKKKRKANRTTTVKGTIKRCIVILKSFIFNYFKNLFFYYLYLIICNEHLYLLSFLHIFVFVCVFFLVFFNIF